ncbi:MAG: hypothetical protein DMG56_19495, partial [Acidobacteria bacterium]
KEIGCGGPVPIVKRITLALRPVVLFFAALLAAFLAMTGPLSGAPQEQEHVKPIPPPVTPLPPEAQSRDVARFSFIAYGDTRGRRDGVAIQYEHSLGKKRRLPATEVSSVSLLASKACRNLLKSLETKAGWSFRVAARRRCGAAEKAARWQKADR